VSLLSAKRSLVFLLVTTSGFLQQSWGTEPAAPQASGKFDVISIRRNRSGAEASDTNTTPGRFSLINGTPLSLILRAFGVLGPQVIGAPQWASTERYDVIAVTGGDEILNDKDRQPFFQAMLAERWNFGFHKEKRNLRVYSLIQSNASKLIPHDGPGTYAMKLEPASNGRTLLRSKRGNMGRFCEILGRFTDNLVTNDTGLAGEYDFTLEWAPDQNSDAAGPSLFTAIQEQLGLKLVPMMKPMDVIVIDHIERPSDN
jgi:uncharacterized protein (TIGR03435 family)